MKTELIVRENNAAIVITAESEFEKTTLRDAAERFNSRHLSVNVNYPDYDYSGRRTPESANVVITLETIIAKQ